MNKVNRTAVIIGVCGVLTWGAAVAEEPPMVALSICALQVFQNGVASHESVKLQCADQYTAVATTYSDKTRETTMKGLDEHANKAFAKRAREKAKAN